MRSISRPNLNVQGAPAPAIEKPVAQGVMGHLNRIRCLRRQRDGCLRSLRCAQTDDDRASA